MEIYMAANVGRNEPIALLKSSFVSWRQSFSFPPEIRTPDHASHSSLNSPAASPQHSRYLRSHSASQAAFLHPGPGSSLIASQNVKWKINILLFPLGILKVMDY